MEPDSPSASPRGREASAGGRMLALSNSGKRMDQGSPPSPSPSPAAPVLVLSNSGKRMDQASPSLVPSNSRKKKYVKQVTGHHNDTELHLAAQRWDLVAVRQILGEIDALMMGTVVEAKFDVVVAEIRSVVVNDNNDVDETTLFIAAEKGFLDLVLPLPRCTHTTPRPPSRVTPPPPSALISSPGPGAST